MGLSSTIAASIPEAVKVVSKLVARPGPNGKHAPRLLSNAGSETQKRQS